jgi:2'-5' RNA ligase
VRAGDRLRAWLRPAPTALIIPVDAARSAVERYQAAAGPLERGMPPHVTTFWPFLRRLSATDKAALDEIAATCTPFEFMLTAIDRFPDVTYLRPEPAEPFVRLTKRVWEQWPEQAPYGGQFADIVPHVTLAHEPAVTARAAVEPMLPIAARAQELVVMRRSPDGWHTLYRSALGANSR